MMAGYAGGQVVPGGIYWSWKRLEFVNVSPEERLSGDTSERYLRAPLPLVLILGPLMGLAYFVFLPLSGLLVLVPFLAGKLRAAVAPAKMSAAHMASPRMQPGMSYLEPRSLGEKPEQEKKNAEEPDARLVDLSEEIARRKMQE